MSLPTLNPTDARNLLDQGAVLVDIREASEHAREKIPGAFHMPLSKLDEADFALHQGRPVIFHCKSGGRTASNAPRLAEKLGGEWEAYVVEGGLDAWKKAGLPNRQALSREDLIEQAKVRAKGAAEEKAVALRQRGVSDANAGTYNPPPAPASGPACTLVCRLW